MDLKQKNIGLLFVLILLLWISYKMSFSKAIAAKNKFSALQQDELVFKSIPEKLFKLNQESIYLDSLLQKNQLSSASSFQNNLLQNISTYSKEFGLKIVSFSKPHFYKSANGTFSTYSFSLQGDFNTITKLIYKLEQVHKFGNIVSVNFEKKKNYRTNTDYLICEILLQRVER